MPLVKVSRKAQIVLPAQIRKKLSIKPGDLLQIEAKNEVIIIKKAPSSFVKALEQYASSIWQVYKEELEQDREQWDEKHLDY